MLELRAISQHSAEILERRLANPRNGDNNIHHVQSEVVHSIRSSFSKNVSKKNQEKIILIVKKIIKNHFEVLDTHASEHCDLNNKIISENSSCYIKQFSSFLTKTLPLCFLHVVNGNEVLQLHSGVPEGAKSICDPFYCEEGYLTNDNTTYAQFMRNINMALLQKPKYLYETSLAYCESLQKTGNVIRNAISPYISSTNLVPFNLETSSLHGWYTQFAVTHVPKEAVEKLKNDLLQLNDDCSGIDVLPYALLAGVVIGTIVVCLKHKKKSHTEYPPAMETVGLLNERKESNYRAVSSADHDATSEEV